MKTIFDKLPLTIRAGATVSLSLAEPFRRSDSLFLLVHHAVGQVLTLTLTKEGGDTFRESFTLDSFPAILVFSDETAQPHGEDRYDQVCFTSFDDFEGSLTYRVRNPERVIAAYRKT
jgi:hypothetical protein